MCLVGVCLRGVISHRLKHSVHAPYYHGILAQLTGNSAFLNQVPVYYPPRQMLVLDEADRILDMGFAATLDAIVANLPREGRQTMLFRWGQPQGGNANKFQ